MKFIDKKISELYYQLYIIIDTNEKKSIITELKKQALLTKEQEIKEKIALYKKINESSNSEQSKNKYLQLKSSLQNLSIDDIKLNPNEVSAQICEHILKDIIIHLESLNIIQVLNYDSTIIGNLETASPITIVYSFPYISYDYQLQYPKVKGNAYLFTTKDVEMIETELLINSNFYTKHKVLYSTEFSDLSFTYICEDDIAINAYMDINAIADKYNIEREQLIGLERKKYLLSNNYGQKCIIDVNEIYDKCVVDINDDIVKKINYLNTKTVKELRKKITDVFSFIYNVNSNVMSLIENIAKVNDFPFDDYCIKHYNKLMGYEEDRNEVEDINQLKLNFVTSYLFATQNVDIEKYFFYIEQEYKMLYQIKKHPEDLTYEEYFNMKAPYYALYEFFRLKKMVTERSYDE